MLGSNEIKRLRLILRSVTKNSAVSSEAEELSQGRKQLRVIPLIAELRNSCPV